MDEQRFFIKGCMYLADDDRLQEALKNVYDTPERPRCMCVCGGIDMYVAKHRLFVVKRMPDTGSKHHPACPSYVSDEKQSGLGELMGEAIIEHSPESVELRVDFPLTRVLGKARVQGEQQVAADVTVPKRRMSLRAVMHFLFEKSGMHKWSPAMEGKRNQGVLHKYLTEAAEEITTKGMRLSERLYVPEPFSEASKSQIAERRRSKLAVLQSVSADAQFNLAMILGEFKGSEATASGRRVFVKHMPDAPLLIDTKAWTRIEKNYGKMFEARDADTVKKPKLMICALIYAKRERTYQIDTASFMLTTEHWIPIAGVDEIDLIHALIEQKRRFVKPLQYDSKSPAVFPNALLLDAGDAPVALHVVSGFADPKDKAIKEKIVNSEGHSNWVWRTEQSMPQLPPPINVRR
jgi:hypothetical protein